MSKLRVILNDQLSTSISSLNDADKNNDIILMCEILSEATYVKHHKKKLAFLFSAMRHFAEELTNLGYKVKYTKLDSKKNSGSFKGEIKLLLENNNINSIIITHPSEYRLLLDIKEWKDIFNIPIEIRTDDRFLSTPKYFSDWAQEKKQLRMEYFYREIRKKYKILVKNNQPIGGKWNYDTENRSPPKEGLSIPKPYENSPDKISQETIELVKKFFPDHFGDLEPFYFAVTRTQALKVLEDFIEKRLPHFGEYQDAMIEGNPWMYHSHISFYLNCGLLLPLECVKAAEEAYYKGNSPINSVEGFIRQIIGWREYIHGIYWYKMPQYQQKNYFEATRNLPKFYWDANIKMNCLHQCLSETKKNAYAHHIQRLMILGNFALITGIEPKQVQEWFLIVYADAYEWVELPNVMGMILFADGGYLASKPYAAGGSYINKMSNYCKNCSYKVEQKNGPDACPFNYLYWYFLEKNKEKLSSNHRMKIIYKTLDNMSDSKKQDIHNDSISFLEQLS